MFIYHFAHSNLQSISKLDVDKLNVKKYIDYLNSKDIFLKRRAAKKLGDIKVFQNKNIVLSTLLNNLKYNDYQLKNNIINSLIKLKSFSLNFLLSQLKNKNKIIRREIVKIFIKLKYKMALSYLKTLLRKDNDYLVRSYSAIAIGKIAKLQGIKFLLAALNDTHWKVRSSISMVLGEIPHNRKSIEALINNLNEKNSYVRMYSAISLGKIKSLDAVDNLIEGLSDSNLEVKKSCIWSLGKIGDSKAVFPLLSILKRYSNGAIKIEAENALIALGISEQKIREYMLFLSD